MFDHMLEKFKENFMNMITSRLLVLVFVLFGIFVLTIDFELDYLK